MVKLGTSKAYRRVAGFTCQRSCKVGTGFDNIGTCQSRTTHMTTRTLLGRALENPGDMARLATRIGVHSAQRKTSFYVIKVAGSTLGQKHATKQQHGQRQKSPKCPIHAGTLLRTNQF